MGQFRCLGATSRVGWNQCLIVGRGDGVRWFDRLYVSRRCRNAAWIPILESKMAAKAGSTALELAAIDESGYDDEDPMHAEDEDEE